MITRCRTPREKLVGQRSWSLVVVLPFQGKGREDQTTRRDFGRDFGRARPEVFQSLKPVAGRTFGRRDQRDQQGGLGRALATTSKSSFENAYS